MGTRDYDNMANSSVVEGKRRAWKRNFNGTALNPESWTVSGSAPTMTYAVAGGALTVNMQTGINEELIITSTESFQLPFRVQITHSIAQRIVNNEVYLEVVNASGDTYVGWLFDGATSTQAKTTHMNGGNSSPASPTGAITVTTGATPAIREINAHIDAVDFSDRTVDSSNVATPRVTKTRSTLDPDERYYIRMRFKNLGVAPVSNTINTIENILVQDTNDVLVEVSAARGDNSGLRSLPVTVITAPTTSVNASASATVGTALTAYRNVAVTAPTGLIIKSTAGKLFGYNVSNPGAAAVWVHFYNKATAPVVGTDTPTHSMYLPAGQNAILTTDLGITHSAGIGVGASDGTGPTSAVAPATAVSVSALYI